MSAAEDVNGRGQALSSSPGLDSEERRKQVSTHAFLHYKVGFERNDTNIRRRRTLAYYDTCLICQVQYYG